MKQKKVRLDAMIGETLKAAMREVADEAGVSLSAFIAQTMMKHPSVLAKVQAQDKGRQ